MFHFVVFYGAWGQFRGQFLLLWNILPADGCTQVSWWSRKSSNFFICVCVQKYCSAWRVDKGVAAHEGKKLVYAALCSYAHMLADDGCD